MSNTVLSPPKPAPSPATLCYHCQDPCPDDQLRIDEKVFCCQGCKLAYEILAAGDLCDYYRMDQKPGLNMRRQRDSRAYAYLDDAEVIEKLLRFNDGRSAQVSFYLPQMHCVSCIWLLENLYKLDAGVSASRVNFLQKTALITFNTEQTSLRKLAALLASIGYAPEINLNDVSGETPQGLDRSLIYKIGVSGFAFGNIMLLSFPEYLGLEKTSDAWFFSVFGWANLLLAIPVLLYSARDYLVSAWQALRMRRLNIDVPLALGIVMLFGRSAWEIVTGTGAGYMDSFAGLIFFLTTGKLFQQKTWRQLSFERDYKSYFPVAANVRKGNAEQAVPVSRLQPGDIIVVRNGELIPADGVLLKGEALLDYSFVSGESEPARVNGGEKVYAGGQQTGGLIEVSLTRRVKQSYLTQLWNNDAFKARTQSRSSALADRAGRYFTVLIISVATAAFGYWAGLRGDIATAVNAFTAVMIIACPCAVALSIPFTMGNVVRILGRNGFYLKNTQAAEAISDVHDVVFDKTGTMTEASDQQFIFEGAEPLAEWEIMAVRSVVKHSSHPISRNLYRKLDGKEAPACVDFEEVLGKGVRGRAQGVCVEVGSATFAGSPDPALRGVHIRIDGRWRGYFSVHSRMRYGLDSVLDYFKSQGKDIWLLSGDQDKDADAFAPLFGSRGRLIFNQKPEDKLRFICNLQARDRRVMMVGDGLNDAGALYQSNAGIVVAEDTNNFTPACDAIVHARVFDRLPQFVELARRGVRTVNRAYLLAFVYNVVGLSYAVTGALSPVVAAILMPLSSVTVVLFGMGMSTWEARRLGLWRLLED
ncbi:MAG: heavy metal translocating P-type ATPase [Saprospiraceae bacterium]